MVDPAGLKRLQQTYRLERDHWESVARQVEGDLRRLLRRGRVYGSVTSRSKETGSLVAKAIRKGRVEPATFKDKAAARVVIPMPDGADPVAQAIRAHDGWEVVAEDDKRAGLGVDHLGYAGLHFDLVVKAPNLDGLVTGPLFCEVQVHTSAQSLWATTSHPLLYKPAIELPVEHQRALHRLSSLAEIFDEELLRARRALVSTSVSIEVAATLKNTFYAVSGMDFGPLGESELVDPYLDLYESSELPQLAETLEAFVARHTHQLEAIYDDAPEAHDVPLLLLPSALFVFERLSARRMLLESRWETLDWSDQVLADFTAIWADGADLSAWAP